MKNLTVLFFSLLLSVYAVTAQTSIRDVDFQNFTYNADYCAGEEGKSKKITVKEGKFYKETKEDDFVDRMYYAVYGTEYGDLDGDGKEEAVILSLCNTGGTGNFTEAYVYSLKHGKAVRIMLLSGGDRAFGGLRKAWIEKGILTVESSDAGERGGACCPEFVVTNQYRYVGRKLKEVGKEHRREIYPASRIKFAKGKFGSTFTLKMGAEENIKRFVVGARKGQTLIVTKTSADAKVSLRRGDANVLEEEESLAAKLNKNGDYVFELSNFSDKALQFLITVTIK